MAEQMVPENLTDRKYWDCGRDKPFKPWLVNSNEFAPVLEKHLPVNPNFTCVEIGAYPGGHLCYLAKRFEYKPVAIELSEHCEHIEKLLRHNGINQVQILQQDFFAPIQQKYDVVTSFGFVEHFENYEAVIDRHFQLVKPGGYVVIGCPYLDNYQGLLRRLVYKEEKMRQVLSTHNRRIMNLDELKRVFRKYEAQLCFADFVMGNNIWLDPASDDIKPEMRWLVEYLKTINVAAGEHLPSSKLYSPMLLVVAQDKSTVPQGLPCGDSQKTLKPAVIQSSLPDLSGQNKPNVLFVVDVPNWAHDFKTDNLMRSLKQTHHCTKKFSGTVTADDIKAADLVVIYYWRQFLDPNMKALIPLLQQQRHKVMMGLCSHCEMEGQWRQTGMQVIEQIAGAVFVNSKLLFEELATDFKVPVFYTPNGVDTTFFTPQKRLDSESLVVGWAGSIKNNGNIRGYHDYIVPAVQRLSGVELRVAAREDKWRTPEQMRKFYQQLDVYICASQTEGTPNPCLEAAACAVPILTTSVGNMPELIIPGVNGYFIERDVDDIADMLDLLKNRRDILAQMRTGILRSIQAWDWKHKAHNFRMMFDAILARADRQENLFQSRGQVYIASADRMDRVLANVAALKKTLTKKVDHYVSVVGGLSGLNYLLSVDPEKITFYDLNTHALEYAKLILELISFSTDHRDFISRVFGRSVETFTARFEQTELTLENQHLYLSMPIDPHIVQDTITRLSAFGALLYQTYIQPFHDAQLLEGVRNCRCLLPCYRTNERVPVGGGQDCGYNEQKQLVPNTNSFFYGHGWLQSKDTFLRVQNILSKCPIYYLPFNLMSGDLDILSDFTGRVVIHASNIDDWFKDDWKERLNTVFQRSVQQQGALHIITTNGGVVKSNMDTHAKAYISISPYVYGKVVEVTHKTPWGFHEFKPENILYSEYLDQDHPADTTILHILVGEGLSLDILKSVFERALRQSKRVLVMEHNQNSADWTDEKAANFLSIEQTQQLLSSIAKDNQASITSAHTIAGEMDLARNVLFVVECCESDITNPIVPADQNSPESQDRPDAYSPVAVSVYMVAYNTEAFVSDAIESVLSQTFKNFELIFVDDGSTDRTAEIAKSYNDPRIRFISQTHRNFATGMNRAIQEARGEFVMGVDSDDFIASDYLEQFIRFAQTNPQYDYYYPSKITLVNAEGKRTGVEWDYHDFSDSSQLPAFLFYNAFSPVANSGSLKRRTMFEKTGLFSNLNNVEDFDFLTRNAMQIRFCRVPDAAGYFYRRMSNTNTVRFDQRNRITAQALERMIRQYPDTVLCSQLVQIADPLLRKQRFNEYVVAVFNKHAKTYHDCHGDIFRQYADKLKGELLDAPGLKSVADRPEIMPQGQLTDPSSALKEKLALGQQYLFGGQSEEALRVYQDLLSDNILAGHIELQEKIRELVEGIRLAKTSQAFSPTELNVAASGK
ncbi:MAG: glycosyltransferase [Phycisphaerae bacterium]|nr:glycosyltransferase [Phycisphaerae bacterium]